MVVAKPKTDQEAEEMRAALAKHDAAEAAARRKKDRETYQPLADFTRSKAFVQVFAEARNLSPAFAAERDAATSLRHITNFMERLAQVAEAKVAPEISPASAALDR